MRPKCAVLGLCNRELGLPETVQRDFNSRNLDTFQSRLLDWGHGIFVDVVEEPIPFVVQFHPDPRNGNLSLVADEEGQVSILDTSQQTSPITKWVAHDNAVFDALWIDNGRKIVTGSGDQSIKIWDVESRVCESSFSGHSCSVKSVTSFEDSGAQCRRNALRYVHSSSTVLRRTGWLH